jgi:hypothetical protein
MGLIKQLWYLIHVERQKELFNSISAYTVTDNTIEND